MRTQDKDFVFALLGAASSIERRLNGTLSSVKGVSFTEYYLLKRLKESHNGSATRVDLARAVKLTPSAITRALKPLEKIGYVATEKGERDARQSVASLTAAGEELLRDANGLVNDEIAGLSIPVGVTAEWTQALESLNTR